MQKYLSVLIAIMASSIAVHAQYTVKGCVTDSAGVSEPYATVRIFSQDNKEKAVKLGVTDLNGVFSQELKQAGKYSLQISSVGKSPINKDFELTADKKTKDFGALIISNNANTLAGVEVMAQKPLVTTEIDRISYDIQADEESKTNTIFEMLRKVPMVTVNGDDKIMVNGSSNFKVYKNGRPNASWSNNPQNVLKSIPASMIKRIEVITEPGAKYDAEGVAGILNIITDDDSLINGVVGTVSANAATNGTLAGNTYITTQVGKFTTSINYSISSLGKASTTPHLNEEFTYTQTGNHYSSFTEQDITKGAFQYGNIETSYEIDSLNLMTFSFGGYFFDTGFKLNSKASMFDQNQNILYSYASHARTSKYRYFDFDGKLDYQHLTRNKGEALTFSYLLSTTNMDYNNLTEYDEMVNFPIDYDSQTNISSLHFYEHTFQFDWTRPIAEKHKVEMGAKYILRQNFSETLNEYSNETYNTFTDFDHITNIGAIYGEYSFNSSKWGARAGLRYEYAHLKGEYKHSDEPAFSNNLGDLVPTFSGSYKLNDANTFRLNFATRINRPGISYLNPAKTITPTSVSYGNPNLESTRRNSLKFAYSLMKPKIVVSASLGYNWANNALSSLNYSIDDIQYSTYANNGKTRSTAWALYLQWTPTKSTQISINGSLSYNKWFNTQNIENTTWGKSFYANIKQNLPWKLVLNANCYGYSDSGDVYSTYDLFIHHGFNISRSFLKDDRLTVKLGADNPFSGKYRYTSEHIKHGDRIGYTRFSKFSRAFGITISYRFGSLNASVKKVNKSISNDDLEGRK